MNLRLSLGLEQHDEEVEYSTQVDWTLDYDVVTLLQQEYY